MLKEALQDPSKTVRYYAAFQAAGLGAPVGLAALPVLKQIVAQEKDDDLVDRARLYILKLDPGALASDKPAPAAGAGPPPTANAKPATWIRVRVYEKGQSKPKVSVNVPVALAEILFDSLPPDAKGELKRKGYDSDNFWPRVKALGPTEVIDIEGDDGERIKVWLE